MGVEIARHSEVKFTDSVGDVVILGSLFLGLSAGHGNEKLQH